MRRISIILIIALLLSACGKKEQEISATVYYIDHDLLMLIGVPCTLSGNTTADYAQNMLSYLFEGQDYNRKIKRQIPNLPGSITVTVDGTMATVDLSQQFISAHEDGRVAERLTVYQIVNSLTSIDGISSVQFLISGKLEKKFKGFLDMREVYLPKEFVM